MDELYYFLHMGLTKSEAVFSWQQEEVQRESVVEIKMDEGW